MATYETSKIILPNGDECVLKDAEAREAISNINLTPENIGAVKDGGAVRTADLNENSIRYLESDSSNSGVSYGTLITMTNGDNRRSQLFIQSSDTSAPIKVRTYYNGWQPWHTVYKDNTVITATRVISPDASVSYIAGSNGSNAAVYAKKTYNQDHWYPAVVLETKGGGSWQIGNYNDDSLQFVYATKANRDSNTNNTSIIYMHNNDTGRIMTSGNYTGWAVSKSGDTMTGDLSVKKSSDGFIQTYNSANGIQIRLAVTGSNHGLWSEGYYSGSAHTSSNKWLIRRDADGDVLVDECPTNLYLQPNSGLSDAQIFKYIYDKCTKLPLNVSVPVRINNLGVQKLTKKTSGIIGGYGTVCKSANNSGVLTLHFNICYLDGSYNVAFQVTLSSSAVTNTPTVYRYAGTAF